MLPSKLNTTMTIRLFVSLLKSLNKSTTCWTILLVLSHHKLNENENCSCNWCAESWMHTTFSFSRIKFWSQFQNARRSERKLCCATIHSKQHIKSELSRMYTFCGCWARFKSTQKRAIFTRSPITATTKNFNCKCVAMTFNMSSILAFSTAPIKSIFMSALRFFFLPLPRFTASIEE